MQLLRSRKEGGCHGKPTDELRNGGGTCSEFVDECAGFSSSNIPYSIYVNTLNIEYSSTHEYTVFTHDSILVDECGGFFSSNIPYSIYVNTLYFSSWIYSIHPLFHSSGEYCIFMRSVNTLNIQYSSTHEYTVFTHYSIHPRLHSIYSIHPLFHSSTNSFNIQYSPTIPFIHELIQYTVFIHYSTHEYTVFTHYSIHPRMNTDEYCIFMRKNTEYSHRLKTEYSVFIVFIRGWMEQWVFVDEWNSGCIFPHEYTVFTRYSIYPRTHLSTNACIKEFIYPPLEVFIHSSMDTEDSCPRILRVHLHASPSVFIHMNTPYPSTNLFIHESIHPRIYASTNPWIYS